MNKSDTAEWRAQGERLRAVRAELKSTAEVFATRLKLSRGYLSELENGKRQMSAKVLDALKEIGVNQRYILAGGESMFDVKKLTDEAPVFFGSQGKQVAKSVAGDAFAAAEHHQEEHAGTSLTPPLLLHVITAVLRQLKEHRLDLPPEKVTELISLIYEDMAASEAPELISERQVSSRTQRLMRLVA